MRSLMTELIWDNHVCLPLDSEQVDACRDLERWRKAGVDVVTVNVGYGTQRADDHIKMLARIRSQVRSDPQRYLLVETCQDAVSASTSGKLGVCFNLEGWQAFEERLEFIELFYDLGVRWMAAVYNHRNSAGSGCMDEEDLGLTALGQEIVQEINRVGALVCCSHTGWRTAADILVCSSSPVIFSHSNAYALHPHMRNIPDELAMECARTGGVVGVNGFGPFLDGAEGGTSSLVNHIEHFVRLIGEDHVAPALDYMIDGENKGLAMVPPEIFGSVAKLLLDRGWSETSVSKLLGGNHLRVAAQVWRSS